MPYHILTPIALLVMLTVACAPAPQPMETPTEPLPEWVFFTSSTYGVEYASECIPVTESEDFARAEAFDKARSELARRGPRILPPHLRDNPTYEVVDTRRIELSGTSYFCVLVRIVGGR